MLSHSISYCEYSTLGVEGAEEEVETEYSSERRGKSVLWSKIKSRSWSLKGLQDCEKFGEQWAILQLELKSQWSKVHA